MSSIDTPSLSSEQTEIIRLPEQLANQIAAGEVIERPASVLKELLENAIDAGASQIDIDINDGGLSLIQVQDNGRGIRKEALNLAVTRFATSKLQNAQQLARIHSLGFRGEALASICSVSRLRIQSRYLEQPDKGIYAQSAWMLDTGTDSDFTDYQAIPQLCALPQGTRVEVRDLFFNLPARRKFLRSARTEFRHIDTVFKRLALSHYGIGFSLKHNNKLIKKLPPCKTDVTAARLARIRQLFPSGFTQHLREVSQTSQNFAGLGQMQFSGWINLDIQPGGGCHHYCYVNQRYVADKLINHAIRQALQEFFPDSSSALPDYILYVNLGPELVDVNVHPAKHEVRFHQARMVHDFVLMGIRRALQSKQGSHLSEKKQKQEQGQDLYPSADYQPVSAQNQQNQDIHQRHENGHNRGAHQATATHATKTQQIVNSLTAAAVSQSRHAYHQPLEQSKKWQGVQESLSEIGAQAKFRPVTASEFAHDVFNFFMLGDLLIAHIESGLLLIKAYETSVLLNQQQIGLHQLQRRLIPERARLTPEQINLLTAQRPVLDNLIAFQIDEQGQFQLKALPATLFEIDVNTFIYQLLDMLARDKAITTARIEQLMAQNTKKPEHYSKNEQLAMVDYVLSHEVELHLRGIFSLLTVQALQQLIDMNSINP